jgi:YidC/Oxa1 family membrane protein insertase
MFWFLTRPVFIVLSFLFEHIGNFGLAILALTVVVRLIFFPLANKQYESMTKMKKVQPAMEELRKKFKDDPARQQQELMALYQRRRSTRWPLLPILVTIPVFFSLFKVLQIDIDMRHAPFVGFIKDLSGARSRPASGTCSACFPTTRRRCARGLAARHPPERVLAARGRHGDRLRRHHLADHRHEPRRPRIRTQQKMLQLMPILFTFIMAGFPIGLLVYYTWSNVLTTLQQYVMMRRFKVDNPIDRIIGASRARRRRPDECAAKASRGPPFTHERTGGRAGLLRPPGDLPDGRRGDHRPAADRPAGGCLRRPLQRRQELADQRVHRPLAPGAGLDGAGAYPRGQLLRRRRDPASGRPAGLRLRQGRRGEKNKFQNLGRAYLRGRPNLKRAFLLIDSATA